MKRFSLAFVGVMLALSMMALSPGVPQATADVSADCSSFGMPDFVSPEDYFVFREGATAVLEWSAVTNAAGYAVFLWEEMDPNVEDYDGEPVFMVNATRLELTGLQPGHWYRWTVRAVHPDPACGLGPGHSSRVFGFTNALGIVPPRPYRLTATDGTRIDFVFLTWMVETDDFKRVYRAAPGGELVEIGTSNDNQHTDWEAQPGVKYQYAVRACNEIGCGNLSLPDEGWRAEGCPVISAPDGLQPEAGAIEYYDQENGIFAHVTWNAVPQALEYYTQLLTEDGRVVYEFYGVETRADLPEMQGDFYWRARVQEWVRSCPQSDWSAKRLIRLRPYPGPLPAQNVSATDGAFADRVRMTWSAPPPNELGASAELYSVYRAEIISGDQPWQLIKGEIEGLTYDDTNVTPGKRYYYTVQACTLANCSTLAIPDTGFAGTLTDPCPVIPKPSGLEPENGATIDSDGAYVKWDWIDGVKLYDTQVYALDKKTLVREDIDDGQVTTFRNEEADYYWRVKGMAWIEGCSDGPWSELRLVHIRFNPGQPPLPPTNLSASLGEFNDRVHLKWEAAPPNENGVAGKEYTIYRAESQNGPWTSMVSNYEALEYDDRGVKAGKNYYYTVAACSPSDCSEPSAVVSGFARPVTPTAAKVTLNSDNLRLSWSGVKDISRYRVYRASAPGAEKKYLAEVNGTSFTDYPPAAGQTFYYWLKACGADHCSEYSPPVSGAVADVIELKMRIFIPVVSR